ncbi:MAG: hypothetical protein FJ279_25325 [Planctomycetes bacterium]|nr:hypothetical protein [Planctomycetota bacterium]
MSAVLIQLAIFFGALPGGKTLKSALSLALGMALLWDWTRRRWFLRLLPWEVFPHGSPSLSSIVLIGSLLAAFACLHVFSVALLSPHSANRALPARVTMTLLWLLGMVFVTIGPSESRRMAIRLCLALTTVGVLIAVSERETPNARIRRSIPRNQILRILAFPFFSGAANGILWATLVAAATFGVAWLFLPDSMWWWRYEDTYTIPVLFLYALAYALSAVLIRRWFLRDGLSYRHTGLLALGLMGIGVVVPLLLSVLSTRISSLRYLMPPWHLGNVTAIFYYHEAYLTPHMLFAGGWAAIVLILNRPWLADQIRAFRPPDA